MNRDQTLQLTNTFVELCVNALRCDPTDVFDGLMVELKLLSTFLGYDLDVHIGLAPQDAADAYDAS